MRLHFAPGTVSIAVAIALEEADLPYQTAQLDFKAGDQAAPAYLAINPKGRVPALEVGDTVLTETGAILDYIASQKPSLMPTDPIEAARLRSVMYYLASTLHVNHAHKMRGHRWADQPASHADMAAKVPQTMTASARYIEDECLRGPLLGGGTFTIADAYLFITCTWLAGDGVTQADFPKIETFMATMEARASVKSIREKGLL